MAKVHLVTDAQVIPVDFEYDGATPIRPLRAVVLRSVVPTSDEFPLEEIPGRKISLALHPDLAREVARGLQDAVRELEAKGRR